MKACNSALHVNLAWENASLHEDCPVCSLIQQIEDGHEAVIEALKKKHEQQVTDLEGEIEDLKARLPR